MSNVYVNPLKIQYLTKYPKVVVNELQNCRIPPQPPHQESYTGTIIFIDLQPEQACCNGAKNRYKRRKKMRFKGSVSQDFQSLFIHYSNPSGPMINRLKSILEFLFDFADILEFLRNSAVCITKRKKIKYNSKTLQAVYQWPSWVEIVNPGTEVYDASSINALCEIFCFKLLQKFQISKIIKYVL